MAVVSGFEGVPWMTGGGARHSADIGRLMAYVGSGGAEGIVNPGDWKVTANSTPNGKINIARGAGAIRNREPGADSQSYAVRAPGVSSMDIDLPANSARSDLIIVRVEDPQYGWPAYADGTDERRNGPYVFPRIISGVSSSITRATQLGISDSMYAIARIDLPAGASVVLPEYITDLRRLAQPRQERYFDSLMHVGANMNLSPTESQGVFVRWPTSFQPNVEVPEWATTFRQTVTLANVRQFAEPTTGQFRAMLDTIGGAAPVFDLESGNPTGAPGVTRTLVAANGGDCRAIAGTTVQVWSDGLVTAGGLFLASGSVTIHDIEFYERPI